MSEQQSGGSTRRDFIRSATAAAVATTVASSLDSLVGAYAAGSDEIRVGLVGCGGRGTGAAGNVLKAAPGVRIVALADAFRDRLDECRETLAKEHADTATVAEDHCFVGLDAFQQLLKTDVNYVILATPPGFRPVHIKAAIEAGKNIFAEKPVAVDAAGVRACLGMADEVTKRGIAMAAGTQYRHFDPYIQSMKRIHDGSIGTVTAARAYYNTSELWKHDRKPEWTELENQMRNWLYYTWLSGDHIVEQFIHNIDAMNWALQGHPIRAIGTGGRQVRTAPEYGHIYDHFADRLRVRQRRVLHGDVPAAERNRQEGRQRVHRHQGLGPGAAELRDQRSRTPGSTRASRTTCTCRSTRISSRASVRASR